MKQKMLPVLFIFLFQPHFSTAAIRPIFIFSLGGGYSIIADREIRSGEYVFDTLIDFKEKLELNNLWSFNLQAYFLEDFGIQVEYTHQKASYFSDLKWYGWWDTTELPLVYVPINHFEDAYWNSWSLKSFSVGFIVGGNRPLFGDLFPYATAGIGLYKMKGDPDLFLYRSRFSNLTHGMTVKISGGIRYRVLPFLGLNLRISGVTIGRFNPTRGMSLYMGPDQLDFEMYYLTGHISRTREAMARSFSYLSVEINLEIILKLPHRSDK